MVLTCSGVMRATKAIGLKSIADKAIALCAAGGHQVETVLVYENDNALSAADTPFTQG